MINNSFNFQLTPHISHFLTRITFFFFHRRYIGCHSLFKKILLGTRISLVTGERKEREEREERKERKERGERKGEKGEEERKGGGKRKKIREKERVRKS